MGTIVNQGVTVKKEDNLKNINCPFLFYFSSCNTSSDVGSTRPIQKTKDPRMLGQTRKVGTTITPKNRVDTGRKAEGEQWQDGMDYVVDSNVKLVEPADCNKSVRSKRMRKQTVKARELEEVKARELEEVKARFTLRSPKETKKRKKNVSREVQGVKKLKLRSLLN